MRIGDLEIYNLSMDFSDKVWNIVTKWEYFTKDIISKQWVRASGSVDANISEGLGRYSAKDSKSFYIIARGSLQESKTWLKKGFRRSPVPGEEYKKLLEELEVIEIKLSRFITKHIQLSQNK